MSNKLLLLVCCLVVVGPVLSRLFNNGYYADHPSYRSDTPHPITLRLIPFGLPRGGTTMRGLPYGLLAYAAKYGSWKNMLKKYQSSRMQERTFQMNYGRAYQSWSTA